MTADEEEDIPGSGAVCTFGKTRFAGNLPGMFWVKNDPVIHVACGDEHSVFITAAGRTFSFGSNEYGQLGHGHKTAVVRPKCIKALKDQRAVLVACGRAHTLVATDDLKVYGFGVNTEHQLGLDSQEFQQSEPALIAALTGLQIKQLAAGAEHSIALTDKGTAYVWGGGKEGQLGLGTKSTVPAPLELKVDIRIMCISAGYYHTAIVSVDGILYTFGERDGGKLGLPKTLCCKRYNKPTEVSTIPGKIVSVSCGGTHTMALTAEGKVYAFGDGRNGQLGLGNKALQSNKPQTIPFHEGIKIAKVVCGESHTAFLSDKRQLFTCGDARHGKLALVMEDASANQFTPVLVEELLSYQVQQVACGGCHTLVLVVPGSGHEANAGHDAGAAGDITLARLKRRHRKATLIENDDHDDIDGCEEDMHVTARVLGETGKEPKRKPLLQEVETDTSIRHVDSDVSDDDASEMSVLNKTHIINHIGSKEILSALEHEEKPQALRGDVKPPQRALQNGDKGKLNGPKEDSTVTSNMETPKMSALGKLSRKLALETPKKSGPDSPKKSIQGSPKKLAVETPKVPAPEVPKKPAVETPKVPAVEVPKKPVVETPKVPAVGASKKPAVETPKVPTVEAPKKPAVETPKVPALEVSKKPALEMPKLSEPGTPKKSALSTAKTAATDTAKKVAPDTPKKDALDTPKKSVLDASKKPVTAAADSSDNKTDSEVDERREKVRWLPAYKDSPKHQKELEKAKKGTPTKRFGKKKKDEPDKDAAKGDAKGDESEEAQKDSKSSTCVVM